MSEWKWCEDCGHHYRAHLVVDTQTGEEKMGACGMDGCDCRMMAFNLADF